MVSGKTGEEVPLSLHHALAKAASDGGLLVGPEDPLGAGLQRFCMTQEKLGTARLAMDSEIVNRMHLPFQNTLKNAIGAAEVSLNFS